MPNQYDRIPRENVDFLAPVIATWRGVDMRNHEVLKDKLHVTLENEVDFCAKILHDDPDFNEIFHIEFQSTPIYSPRRGRLYNALLGHIHNLPVRQIVVYLGDKKHNMATELIEPQITYRAEIINIKDFSYRYFLERDAPEEIIMAILADLEGEDAEKIIVEILNKIRKFSPPRASTCTVQMQVLSNLRNLQDSLNKILKKMPLAIDLSKDPFFSREFARAETIGKTEGKTEVIINLLKTGRFSVEEIADFVEMPLTFVLNVQKEFNTPPKKRNGGKKS